MCYNLRNVKKGMLLSMNKKLQVFVSSTYTDLIEERQAAVQAILDAGHIPAGMELFKAGKSQMQTIRKWIDESDVYMLILGGRYGSIEEESCLSYTELEYRYAISKNMPVFAIVLDESFLHIKASNTSYIFERKNKSKYKLFKKYVETKIVLFVNNIDQISSNIHSQLKYILDDSDYHLVGWVRAININDNAQTELIGKYNFITLLSILKEKTFDIPKNCFRLAFSKSQNALFLFKAYYKDFCTGIENPIPDYDRNLPLIPINNSDINIFLYYEVCPYLMSFDLLTANNKIYTISQNGKYFYSLLISNDYTV